MAGAIRAKKTDMPMEARMPEMTSHMSINMKKMDEMKGEYGVGDTVNFKGKGKITAERKDRYGHSMDMDVTYLCPADEEKEDDSE